MKVLLVTIAIDFQHRLPLLQTNILPGTCASVSSWSPGRWCVGGPRLPVWSAPTLLCLAQAEPAASAPSPPSSSSLDSPQSGAAWLYACFHPAPLISGVKENTDLIGIFIYWIMCLCVWHVSYKETMFITWFTVYVWGLKNLLKVSPISLRLKKAHVQQVFRTGLGFILWPFSKSSSDSTDSRLCCRGLIHWVPVITGCCCLTVWIPSLCSGHILHHKRIDRRISYRNVNKCVAFSDDRTLYTIRTIVLIKGVIYTTKVWQRRFLLYFMFCSSFSLHKVWSWSHGWSKMPIKSFCRLCKKICMCACCLRFF